MSGVSRRRLLQGGAAALFATMLSDGASWAAVKPPAPQLHPVFGSRYNRVAEVSSDPPPSAPADIFLAPFTATASSTLSEDYFLTNEVMIGAGDRVLPFQRPNGAVEALVFNTSGISYLQRDATSSSGWTYNQVSFPSDWLVPPDTLVDCAVQLGSDGTVYAVFTQLDVYNDGGYLIVNWMALAAEASSWSVADPGNPEEFPGSIGPLRAGHGPGGEAHLYAVNSDGTILLWQPQSGYTGISTVITGLPIATFIDAALLWNPGFAATDPVGVRGAVIVVSEGTSSLYVQVDGATVTHYANFNPFSLIVWLDWPNMAGQPPQGPAYAAQQTDGTVVLSDGISGQSAIDSLGAQAGQAVVWSQGGLLTFALLLGTTLNVVAQWDSDPQSIAFTPAIPIVDLLTAVTGCATDPAQGTLFAVDTAQTLRVLTKDPTTGIWTDTPVHRATASTQEIDCWRQQITLTDANNMLLANCQVTVTPDRAIGIWQPTGSVDSDPAHPVATTTDDHGVITLAIPATEIDAPMLSVQVFQANSPFGPPVAVNPAQNVHDFFAGTGSIDSVGSITGTDGSALTNAQLPGGGALFPVLGGISDPTQQSAAAAGVAAAINQCMTAATAGPPGPTDTQSFNLDFSSGTPTYTSSTSPDPTVLASSSWWDSVKHDAESALHAVRHGLIEIEHCAASWSADAASWAVNLAIKIGDAVSDTISYAITDIRSAVHAISGFFAKLGADIKAAITWLRTNIKETLNSAAANTRMLLGWMGNLGSQLTNDLNHLKTLETGYFTSREGAVNAEINNVLVPGANGLTLGQFTDQVNTTEPAGLTPEQIALDVVHVWHDASASWLLHKLQSEFDSATQTPGSSTPLSAAINELTTIVSGANWLITIAATLWETFKTDSKEHLSDVKELAFVGLLKLAQGLVDDILQFVEDAIAAVIGLAEAMLAEWVDLLGTNLLAIPLLSEILNWFGVDLQLSVGHMFGMVLMFPTTIAYRAKFGGDGTMFTTNPPPAVALDADPLAVADPLGADLNFAHAAIRGCGALVDSMVDLQVYSDDQEDAGPRVSPLKWVGYLDTIFTAAINVVTYPGVKNSDGTTAEPFVNPVLATQSTPLNDKVYAKYLLSWFNPIASAAAQACSANDVAQGYTKWSPFLRSALGIGLFALGLDINMDKDATGEATVGNALETVPSMLSPLAMQQINSGTLDIPLGLKIFIDAVLEPSAAVLVSES